MHKLTPVEHIRGLFGTFISFIRTDIWRVRLKHLSRPKALVIRTIRVMLIVFRGINLDNCHLRASALTFYTLLSIVPVTAMAFAVAKGFGFQKMLHEQLVEQLAGHEEIVERVISFSHTLLESTKGGVMAGIGVAVLLWAVVKVLSHIEDSFNEIWEVKKARSLGRKLSDYVSTMIILPFFVIMSGSINVLINTQVRTIAEKIDLLAAFSPVLFRMIELMPYVLIWVLFTFVYMLMPNTRVRFRSAFVAGIVAGTVYQLTQWIYISFQVGVARYNAIYGSFAALPLFLVWLQLSWLIVLFGAELSFAHQNVGTYEFEPDSRYISVSGWKLMALNMTHEIVMRFHRGNPPLTAAEISDTLEVPYRLARRILDDLVTSGVISEVQRNDEKEPAYQPALDINILTVGYIIDALEKNGIGTIPVERTRELAILTETLDAFHDAIAASPANKLLKDL